MYPKVKVRQQEDDDDQYAYETSSDDFPSPVINCEDDSPTPIVRIPGGHISRSALPAVTVSKGVAKNNKKAIEENKQNIKGNPIPRPRAVMSSPDNDVLIGSKSRTRAELFAGVKNSNSCLNRHAQCKVLQSPVLDETPADSRRKPKNGAYATNVLEGKANSKPLKVEPSLTREWIS